MHKNPPRNELFNPAAESDSGAEGMQSSAPMRDSIESRPGGPACISRMQSVSTTSELWLDKHRPNRLEDLVVHPKKVLYS
jgi:hypothetical protein